MRYAREKWRDYSKLLPNTYIRWRLEEHYLRSEWPGRSASTRMDSRTGFVELSHCCIDLKSTTTYVAAPSAPTKLHKRRKSG